MRNVRPANPRRFAPPPLGKGAKYVRPSVKGDVDVLFERMPVEDRDDLARGWGGYGMTPKELLEYSFENSMECLTIVDGDEVLGMFGVVEAVGGGWVWLMRAHDIGRVAIRFVRHGHVYVEKWLERYKHLTGMINKRYVRFVRWLEWEGFTLTDCGDYWMVEKWAL